MDKETKLFLKSAHAGIEATKLYIKSMEELRLDCEIAIAEGAHDMVDSYDRDIHLVLKDAVKSFEEIIESYDELADGTPGKTELKDELCNLAAQLMNFSCGYPKLELRILTSVPDLEGVLLEPEPDELYSLSASKRAESAMLFFSAAEEYFEASDYPQGKEMLHDAIGAVEKAFEFLSKVTEEFRWKSLVKEKLIEICQKLSTCDNPGVVKRAVKILDGPSEGRDVLEFTCPLCSAVMEIEKDWYGQEAECPSCGKDIIIEKPAIAAEEPSTHKTTGKHSTHEHECVAEYCTVCKRDHCLICGCGKMTEGGEDGKAVHEERPSKQNFTSTLDHQHYVDKIMPLANELVDLWELQKPGTESKCDRLNSRIKEIGKEIKLHYGNDGLQTVLQCLYQNGQSACREAWYDSDSWSESSQPNNPSESGNSTAKGRKNKQGHNFFDDVCQNCGASKQAVDAFGWPCSGPKLDKINKKSTDSSGGSAIGMRFDIEKGYGQSSWILFWKIMDPEILKGSRLFEGDTAKTLERKENVFCIAVENDDPKVIAQIKDAFSKSSEFKEVCAQPMFVEGKSAAEWHLPEVNEIDRNGEFVGDADTERQALDKGKGENTPDLPEEKHSQAEIPVNNLAVQIEPEQSTKTAETKEPKSKICPKCQAPLENNALKCQKCGWRDWWNILGMIFLGTGLLAAAVCWAPGIESGFWQFVVKWLGGSIGALFLLVGVSELVSGSIVAILVGGGLLFSAFQYSPGIESDFWRFVVKWIGGGTGIFAVLGGIINLFVKGESSDDEKKNKG